MTWIAIGLGEVRRKDERFTPAVPLWSRQWTSRCRRPRKLFYIDFLLIFSRHDLPSASRRRKMLPCTEEEVEALFYFISNLYLTLYPIRTLSIPFPNFTAVHGVGVAQAKPACKHTIYLGSQTSFGVTACCKRSVGRNCIYIHLGTKCAWTTLTDFCWKFVGTIWTAWPTRGDNTRINMLRKSTKPKKNWYRRFFKDFGSICHVN